MLVFQYDKMDEAFTVWGMGGNLFPLPNLYRAKIALKREELFVKVNRCRSEWQRWVVEADEIVKKKRLYPFQRQWDLSRRTDLLSNAGPKLAVAGHRLFQEIFRQRDGDLNAIAEKLEKASVDRRLVLTLHSNDFFIPWGMLYTHPDGGNLKADGSNWNPKGFWGARHILEHNTDRQDLRTVIQPVAKRLHVGLNVDIGLDNELPVAVVQPVVSFFQGIRTAACSIRTTKAELRDALTDPRYNEQIVYFCCHGVVTGVENAPNFGESTIALSDRPREDITVGDIEYWLKNRALESNPVIFINTCQGGQMASLFYRSFAAEFLRRQANCVIGAQVDVPAVFAAEYAQRFFAEFLKGKRRVGELVRDLAWQFLDTYKNPVGLIYSLYSGADTYFDAGGSE